jgi:hypothetical protein
MVIPWFGMIVVVGSATVIVPCPGWSAPVELVVKSTVYATPLAPCTVVDSDTDGGETDLGAVSEKAAVATGVVSADVETMITCPGAAGALVTPLMISWTVSPAETAEPTRQVAVVPETDTTDAPND